MKKIFLPVLLFFFQFSVFSQSKRPIVTGINASSNYPGRVIISWDLPKNEKDFIHSFKIYRDTKPLQDYEQLSSLEPVATLYRTTESYVDTIKASNTYFYAIVTVMSSSIVSESEDSLYYDQELDPAPDENSIYPLKIILPGVNSTAFGIKPESGKVKPETEIPQKKNSIKKYNNKLREQPLPFINLIDDDRPSRKNTIRKSTEKEASLLALQSPVKPKPLPQFIFEDDVVSPAGGDEYLLFEILKDSFINRDYIKSCDDLKRFLQQNRNTNVTARTNFYIGECYYFTGQFSSAITHFLKAEDTYPALCRKWIENTLDLYEVEK